ncbi:MAG: sulfotransferase [Cyanobacteriota bacterium]|nr:sulfotransferase [Cyanobacteriota bacterium]
MIIGQVKCGTSSLYSYLTQHPQILPAIKKEIHFWNNNFNKGINWYLAHFPSIDSGQNLITGEATPNYLESQKVAESLFQEFPNIKLIVLLRNPVDRAISQYYMFVKKGKEKRSVEKAILSEIESITRKSNINSLNNFNISNYIKRSQYIEHLSQWMEIFPRNQFLIVKSEDLFVTPETTVDRVFQFLGVESYQLPKYPKVNPGKYPPIPESMRQTMNDYFRPFNQQLEEYLDRKFNWYC